MNHLDGIEQLEARLWKVSGDLRANSEVASNENITPIPGLLFLPPVSNWYHRTLARIELDKTTSKLPEHDLIEADFRRQRAMMLPGVAKDDTILERPKDGTLGAAFRDPVVAGKGGALGSPGGCQKTATQGKTIFLNTCRGPSTPRDSEDSVTPRVNLVHRN